MNVNLTPYSGKKICVAVSGGRDSMALLHYFAAHAKEFFITISALNCDHGIRGEESKRDSEFVKAYCLKNAIPLTFFKAEEGSLKSEQQAREWRFACYNSVLEAGADYVACAHHLNDNAETVLFNLARGAALSGLTGIAERGEMGIIRPFIACTREEIDAYVGQNNIPYVTDSTNLTCNYTRNKIRLKVLPALEEAVPGAAGAIYRFSRLAAEDEEYFSREVDKVLVRRFNGSYLVKSCTEPVIFKRVIARILKENNLKDYTYAQLRTVYEMQWLGSGKRFEFLGLTAVKEDGGIAIFKDIKRDFVEPFGLINRAHLRIVRGQLPAGEGEKALFFDLDKVPQGSVIRTKREGDKLTKFGGGRTSLSDYFTDKKVPQALRGEVPLICKDGEVLAVCGVDIADGVRIDGSTKNIATVICPDFMNI